MIDIHKEMEQVHNRAKKVMDARDGESEIIKQAKVTNTLLLEIMSDLKLIKMKVFK